MRTTKGKPDPRRFTPWQGTATGAPFEFGRSVERGMALTPGGRGRGRGRGRKAVGGPKEGAGGGSGGGAEVGAVEARDPRGHPAVRVVRELAAEEVPPDLVGRPAPPHSGTPSLMFEKLLAPSTNPTKLSVEHFDQQPQ